MTVLLILIVTKVTSSILSALLSISRRVLEMLCTLAKQLRATQEIVTDISGKELVSGVDN